MISVLLKPNVPDLKTMYIDGNYYIGSCICLSISDFNKDKDELTSWNELN